MSEMAQIIMKAENEELYKRLHVVHLENDKLIRSVQDYKVANSSLKEGLEIREAQLERANAINDSVGLKLDNANKVR